MLARKFARALLCGFPGEGLEVDDDHRVARLVDRSSHPDLMVVAPGWDEKRRRHRSEILVDEVRAISHFLSLTPAMGGWRVVIVDGADHLNRNAANAALKLLEEPPARTLLVMTAQSAGALLPTIRSRCRRIRLSPLSERELHAVVARHLPDDVPIGSVSQLLALAHGSPGRALGWIRAGLSGVAAALASGAPIDAIAADRLADEVGRENETTLAAIDLIRAGIAAGVRTGAFDAGPTGPLATRADDWAELGRSGMELERFNLDRRQAILDACRMLQQS